MKAFRYNIKVCDTTLEMVHGGGRTVKEVYIPDLRIFLNDEREFGLKEEEECKRRFETGKNVEKMDIGPTMELMLRSLAAALHVARVTGPLMRKKLFAAEGETNGGS